VLDAVARVLHGRGRHPGRGEPVGERVALVRNRPCLERAVELVLVRAAAGDVREADVARPFRVIHYRAQPAPVGVVAAGDRDPGVVDRRIGTRRAAPSRAVALRLPNGVSGTPEAPSVHLPVERGRTGERDARLDLRHVDVLARDPCGSGDGARRGSRTRPGIRPCDPGTRTTSPRDAGRGARPGAVSP
jgi:hypothetical protein